jgi:uncharacterized membrane protein YgcG
MNKFLLLFVAAITLTCCDNADSSNESGDKILLLEKNKIECSFEGYSDRIFVKTNITFDLDTEEFCSWIDYKAGKDCVFINLDKNWSIDERSCYLILTNDQYSLSDTLIIIQEGYKSNENNGSSSGNGGNSTNGNNSGGNGSNNGSSSGGINNGGSSISRQCAAYTKKGKRCKRTASKGSIYCWQHQK